MISTKTKSLVGIATGVAMALSLISSVSAQSVTFTQKLQAGSTGAQVSALQSVLVAKGFLVMPAGVSMGYFGSLTAKAVVAFQKANGITPVVPTTGAALNGVGPVSTPTTPVSSSAAGLSVSLASSMSGAVIAGQAAAPLADYTFRNTTASPILVTNVSLTRGGVSADTDLANVYLYSGVTRLTDAASVSSGKVTFNSGSGLFVVPAGASMVVSVKADIDASSSAGSIINISLTGVNNTAIAPVTGGNFSVASGVSLAAVSFGSQTAGNVSVQAGSMNQTIFSAPLNVSGRAVYLRSVAVKVIGSVPSDALTNFKLYASGIQIGSAYGIDMNGYVTFDINPAYKLDSTRTLEIRADVVKGSSRTFTVSVQNASDVQVIDSNYNVAIGVTGNLPTTGLFTINSTTGGTLNIVADTTLSSGDVVTGATQVPLARYTVQAYGEDIKISQVAATTTHVGGLQNVAIYAGASASSLIQIGSTQTLTNASGNRTFNLGSSLIIPAGQKIIVEVRGDIKNSDGTNATTTGANTSLQVSLLDIAANAQGRESSSLSTTTFSGATTPTMTVKSAVVSLSASSYPNQSTVANQAYKIGSYTFSNSSAAEAVNLNSVTVTLNNAGVGAYTNLSNLYIVAGSWTSQPVPPSSTGVNNFNLNGLTVAANGSLTIDVYANLGPSTSGFASTSLSVSGYGVSSNTIVSQSAIGQTIAVGSGTVSVPTLKAGQYSVSAQFVTGDSSFVVGQYNFTSTVGTSYINELTFNASGTSANGVSSVTVGNITKSLNGTTTVSGLNIPVDTTGTIVPVTVTFNHVAYANGVTTNETVGLELTGYKYTSGSSQTSTTTVAVDTNLMTLVHAYPKVTFAGGSQTGVGTGVQKLASITLIPTGGQVSLLTLPISISAVNGGKADGSASNNVSVYSSAQPGVDLVAQSIASVTTFAAASSTHTSTTSITFSAGYDFSSPVTFDIYDNVTLGTTGDSVSTKLGAGSLFTFIDTVGSSTEEITAGTNIPGYPTTAVSTLAN